jgi:hypothetical protein
LIDTAKSYVKTERKTTMSMQAPGQAELQQLRIEVANAQSLLRPDTEEVYDYATYEKEVIKIYRSLIRRIVLTSFFAWEIGLINQLVKLHMPPSFENYLIRNSIISATCITGALVPSPLKNKIKDVVKAVLGGGLLTVAGAVCDNYLPQGYGIGILTAGCLVSSYFILRNFKKDILEERNALRLCCTAHKEYTLRNSMS